MKYYSFIFVFLLTFGCNKVEIVQDIRIDSRNSNSQYFFEYLYPYYSNNISNEYGNWSLQLTSYTNFIFSNNSYNIITWNEINNTNVNTQYERYRYGGLYIFKNGKSIGNYNEPCLIIKDIIFANNIIGIICDQTIDFKGSMIENIMIYKIIDDYVYSSTSETIAENNYAGSGSYYYSAKVNIKDINNDNIKEIIITPLQSSNYNGLSKEYIIKINE